MKQRFSGPSASEAIRADREARDGYAEPSRLLRVGTRRSRQALGRVPSNQILAAVAAG